MRPISLVIVERRTLVREGLAALLRAEPDFAVSGSVGKVGDCAGICQANPPEILLASASLPEDFHEERMGFIARLAIQAPNAAICVLGRAGDTIAESYAVDERRLALRRGAAACISPLWNAQEMLRTLRAVAAVKRGDRGEEEETEEKPALRTSSARGQRLTERERTIILLISEGLSNKEIAARLGNSPQTVKNHVSHLLEKLALVDRTQLAVYVLEHKLREQSS